MPYTEAVLVVTKAPILSCVPGTPAVSDLLSPNVFPVKVIAPVALKVARTTRGIVIPPFT
ncbi:hypothetical protein ABE099_15460 [Paenibacillus turicensis]|uniref:hypothetical protein n=1 Tax=Paenibacillus turicensis TaxID=160487 RepID=UPI003D2E1FBD